MKFNDFKKLNRDEQREKFEQYKLFEVKEAKNDKTQWSGVQTLITPKGRETFRLLYL